MSKGRLEAFSDAVIAIAITVMVLELKVPQGADWAALRPLVTTLLTYVLSFVFLGIYWNNHHHLLHATNRINGTVLWANLHLLFWLSLIPFVTFSRIYARQRQSLFKSRKRKLRPSFTGLLGCTPFHQQSTPNYLSVCWLSGKTKRHRAL